jgi:PAS domain S-box-containing protein
MTSRELLASEARYRSLFDTIADPLFVYDRVTLGYLAVNAAAVRVYGYSMDEFLGMTIKDIRPVEDVTALLDMLAAAGTGREDRGVWRHCKQDGTIMEVEISAHGLEYGGRPACVIQARDVTEKRRIEAQVARSHALLRAVADGVSDAVFVKDRAGKYLLFNEAAARFVGKAAEEVVGKDDTAVFESESARIAMDGDRLVMESDRVYRTEERLTASGITRVYEAIKTPYRDTGGEVIGVIGVSRDITDRKHEEDARRQQQTLLRIAGRIARLGGWSIDLAAQQVAWSDEVCAIHDEPPGYQPSVAAAIAYYLPEDRPVVTEAVERCIADGTPFDVECQLRTAKGRDIWVRSIGEAVHDQDGRVTAVHGAFQDITDRKRAEAASRHAEELLLLRDRAIQAVSQGILVTDPQQAVLFVSGGFERMTGYPADEIVGRNCRFLQGAGTDAEAVREMRTAIAEARSCTVEILNYRKDGTPFWNEVSITPVLGRQGQVTHFVGVQTDITQRRKLEDQYRQSQKMEAVGRLAGGVAHDFNNLLTIISGYTELLLAMPAVDDVVRDSIVSISEASEQAASLTRQLLGFSRKSLLQPKVLDLNALIAKTSGMLRRLIGEDILLTTVLDPKISPVRMDPGQLDQVLMNLAVNARDAMPSGGKLTIETRNVLIGAADRAAHLDCQPGPRVMVAMTDTGCGMTPEVMVRIFEPFYTTKPVGRGTGLGLSMVFGIIEQSGGCMHVYSEPDRGTTFKMYLPAVNEQHTADAEAAGPSTVQGTETILLVEDADGVRGLASMSLRMHGYQVLTAIDGKDALRVARAHHGPLHMVLTDVVMPRLGGPLLVEQLQEQSPDLKVLFMSGYTDDAVVRHGLIEADMAFIQKPYTPLALARKVRQVLDAPSTPGRRSPADESS